MEDPIIEELHQFREEWAARFNYDIHAIVADLRRSQQEANRQVVNLPPRLVADINEAQEQVSELIYREKMAKPLPEELAELADQTVAEEARVR